MEYQRIMVYPDGKPVPSVLPASYQVAVRSGAPDGQQCSTCRNFDSTTRQCSRWQAVVRPDYWCQGWLTKLAVLQPFIKITHNIVEEHYREQPSKYNPYNDPEETIIKVTAPLMIQLLEWAKTQAGRDIDLHLMIDQLIELSQYEDTLTITNYPDIVQENKDHTKGE